MKTFALCPNCKKKLKWSTDNPFRPFCSERCKLIDLGAWADGSYAIPSEEPILSNDELPYDEEQQDY